MAPVALRQTSGLTSRLILRYVEEDGGRPAVDALLERAALHFSEEQLRDEDFWFPYEDKLRLFDAASVVLGDPDATYTIGRAAVRIDTMAAIKVALRAWGRPELFFQNIVRMSGKFTWAHTWDVLEVGEGSATVRFVDVSAVGYDASECAYNRGLLTCVPELFGLAPAEVVHERCGADGADGCVYDVRWQVRRRLPGRLLAGTALVSAAIAALSGAELALVPLAALVPAVGAVLVGRAERTAGERRVGSLEREVAEQREVAQRLQLSLGDLVSDLRLDEVLEKIVANARAAVGGQEFALLVAGVGGLCSRSSLGVPLATLAHLERWAEDTPDLACGPVTVEDLASHHELSALAQDPECRLGSLHASPLVLGGEALGVLVALAHGPSAFLARDCELLKAYAAQAAIALGNARVVERLQSLACQDPLTGLLNHRELHERLEQELERARRTKTPMLAVLLLDLDGFKQENDRLGHLTGDHVLREVANALRRTARSGELVARTGGDEFAVVAPGATHEAAVRLASRCERAVTATGTGVGVSWGIGAWTGGGEDRAALLERADRDLYARKRARQGASVAPALSAECTTPAGPPARGGPAAPGRLGCARRS